MRMVKSIVIQEGIFKRERFSAFPRYTYQKERNVSVQSIATNVSPPGAIRSNDDPQLGDRLDTLHYRRQNRGSSRLPGRITPQCSRHHGIHARRCLTDAEPGPGIDG
jgi:hypothetical protein